MNHNHPAPTQGKNWLSGRAMLVACLFLAAIAFLILTGHKAHLFGALPYLLLLACPLAHLFMHGSHDHHKETEERTEASASTNKTPNKSPHQHSGGHH